MNLINTKTGEKIAGIIEKAEKKELKKLAKLKNFVFDWSLETGNQVFKIKQEDKKEILGLISLIDVSEEFRIHINLIESASEYRGKNKLIQNIPGCLIAYACQISFKRGYEGFVSLTPKTRLINYYRDQYGFVQMGTQMAIYYEISNSIILKYIGDEEI